MEKIVVMKITGFSYREHYFGSIFFKHSLIAESVAAAVTVAPVATYYTRILQKQNQRIINRPHGWKKHHEERRQQ